MSDNICIISIFFTPLFLYYKWECLNISEILHLEYFEGSIEMSKSEIIKKVRKNRGFSQAYLVEGIISQGAYSKFEAGLRDLDTTVYLQILNRLNIPLDEFEFIQNDYSYGEKQTIIKTFFSMNYNNIEKLKHLEKESIQFLAIHEDIDIKEIQLICKALVVLYETQDLEQAKQIIKPIWERISKYDQWYLNDICMVNTILFLFPVDTAVAFTKNVLNRLQHYQDFKGIEKLKIGYNINLALLLIKNADFQQALTIIEDSLSNYKKKMNHTILALHFSRKALCQFHLDQLQFKLEFEKACDLLLLYDDFEFLERIQEEYNYYSSLRTV